MSIGPAIRSGLGIAIVVMAANSARAVDPPYQSDMQRVLEIMGSIYFLAPLCGYSGTNWRQSAADLIALDEPDDDRRQRLIGAFNVGYEAYARLYRFCSPAARMAVKKLLDDAASETRELHSHFAE